MYSLLVPKLNEASYLMRVIKPILSIDSLKLVYYAYFLSLITYRIILLLTDCYVAKENNQKHEWCKI